MRGHRKVQVGKVVSDKMDKTVVVEVERIMRDKLYKKVLKRKSKFYAHDEENLCKVNDVVRIMEVRPLSKTKRWRVVEIIGRGDIS
jgi:small subunit ribosomal protein S17